MLELAQDLFKALQERFRTTLNVVADLAASMGVPPAVTALIQPRERADDTDSAPGYARSYPAAPTEASPPPPAVAPDAASVAAEEAAEEEVAESAAEEPAAAPLAQESGDGDRRRARRRGLATGVDLSDRVRPLRVDDEIQGSTYLARIIWCLGVSDLEGTGPLRPADMARMIMSRSPVSLEPPNVARYIRRSKPTCIAVARSEGSSHFYKLNEEGKALFDELYGVKK
jgi:hypothetical protein